MFIFTFIPVSTNADLACLETTLYLAMSNRRSGSRRIPHTARSVDLMLFSEFPCNSHTARNGLEKQLEFRGSEVCLPLLLSAMKTSTSSSESSHKNSSLRRRSASVYDRPEQHKTAQLRLAAPVSLHTYNPLIDQMKPHKRVTSFGPPALPTMISFT